MMMIVISLLWLGLTGVVVVYAFMKPHLAFVFVLALLVGSAWAADVLTANHVGISRVGHEATSIRQDSTTSSARIMYFGNQGYYTRHHMGGGLMGGK